MSNIILLSGLPIRQSKSSLSIKLAYDSGRLEVDLDTGSIYRVEGCASFYLKGFLSRDKYRHIIIKTGLFGSIQCAAHIIIGYAMWGDSALVDGVHIDHIDGDRGNNMPKNLQLLTAYDNISKGWVNYYGKNQQEYKPLKTLHAA